MVSLSMVYGRVLLLLGLVALAVGGNILFDNRLVGWRLFKAWALTFSVA